MKTIIIGGVAGGASAAARLRRLKEDADIIISDTPDKFVGKKDTAQIISPFDTSGIASLVFD